MNKLKTFLALLAVAVAAAALGAVGGTYAFWAENQDLGSATVISHGNLDTTVASTTWKLLDADAETITSGNSMQDLGELRSPCGSGLSLEIKHDVAVDLVGDNMAAKMDITWTSGEATGTYHVTSGGTTVVTERPTGSDHSVNLPAADANYLFTITYPLDECDLLGAESTTKYGGVGVSLKQVRPGL